MEIGQYLSKYVQYSIIRRLEVKSHNIPQGTRLYRYNGIPQADNDVEFQFYKVQLVVQTGLYHKVREDELYEVEDTKV